MSHQCKRSFYLLLTFRNNLLQNLNPSISVSSELIVRVGEWDASGFKNPESARHQEYTVKPIQLNNQDRFGNYQVNTACLPSCRDQFSHRFTNGTGTRCWVAGWGKDRDNGEFQVRQKKVDLPLMDDE